MCYGCYEEQGKPAIYNDIVKKAIASINKVYEYSCVGGGLHIVLDDWNLEDDAVVFCENWINNPNYCPNGEIQNDEDKIQQEQKLAELECVEILKKMSIDERASALAFAFEMIELPKDAE